MEFWISRAIFPLTQEKITREIQNSMVVKIFLAGFIEWFTFSEKYIKISKLHYKQLFFAVQSDIKCQKFSIRIFPGFTGSVFFPEKNVGKVKLLDILWVSYK